MPLYYRIIHGAEPKREHFIADKEAGKPRPPRESLIPLWEKGFSVLDSEFGARTQAIRFAPHLGDHLAELDIEEEAGIEAERTTRTPGHHTIRGDPDAILARVRRVIPV